MNVNNDKVASNDDFLKLIESVTSQSLKKYFYNYIKDNGLTFSERDILQKIVEKSIIP